MLCFYKTLKTIMSSNIFNCCIYRAAVGTFVNDFTWTHCASCVFKTARIIYMLLLIGLTFLTHPPNKRKCFSNPVAHRCTRFQETCRSTRKHSKTLGTGVNLNVPLERLKIKQKESRICIINKCNSPLFHKVTLFKT